MKCTVPQTPCSLLHPTHDTYNTVQEMQTLQFTGMCIAVYTLRRVVSCLSVLQQTKHEETFPAADTCTDSCKRLIDRQKFASTHRMVGERAQLPVNVVWHPQIVQHRCELHVFVNDALLKHCMQWRCTGQCKVTCKRNNSTLTASTQGSSALRNFPGSEAAVANAQPLALHMHDK